MATIHVFRLAEGVHNVLPEFEHVRDPGAQMSSFGSDASKLYAEFTSQIDLNRVSGGWEVLDTNGAFAYDLEKIKARTTAAREWLADLALTAGEGAHIVVMTHNQTAHFVTDDFEGVEAPQYSCDWDDNLSYRSYKFDFSTKTMIETPESRERRGVSTVRTLSQADSDAIKEIVSQRIIDRNPDIQGLHLEEQV
ncbi:hypothetical protein F4804DRAFT_351780 [Jackrogersella minutella]|nr:hypothetical protein F4804DRAFT_351780 [Jackrogersella minutella]